MSAGNVISAGDLRVQPNLSVSDTQVVVNALRYYADTFYGDEEERDPHIDYDLRRAERVADRLTGIALRAMNRALATGDTVIR
jgi:hypothetical protein